MTFIKENYPIVGFIAAYLLTKNLILAAAIWSGLTLIQMIAHYFTKKELKTSHVALFFVGLALVALAYYFNDDDFIKWKTSIAVWAGALFILIRQLASKKYVIKDLTKSSGLIKDSAPESLLAKTNWLWIITLASYGGLNLYIAFNFSTDFWFYFKLISMFVLLFGLLIISMIMLKDHLHIEEEQNHQK
ncbi:inner membrane-spanning protein YciB [Kangiella sediminilitoris]|uniref:Intracellular septation protein A n=1 Tax=Kangiella sediminilitoris TaxID=1144748 RepID=A0A1B3BBS5_9GAMM|nr:septation protein IspZ [Kangiella sediminilitoris]AOE50217.1 Intracellular septation protein A [Kangiella sediminilitoris]